MFHLKRGPLFLRRGYFKFLVLRTLKQRPMHGYEIMQTISQMHNGLYQPSPGIVYPTLQMLEDQGYITSEEKGGKKVYAITPDGKKFLKEEGVSFREHMESRKKFFEIRAGLHREIRSFARLMVENQQNLTPEKIIKIRDILKEAREKAAAVVHE